MIGLSGGHRCGKTSLARAYAEKYDLEFLETSASAVFKELGYDPAVTYDFQIRMEIQETILMRFDRFYGAYRGKRHPVTDRTPLDMLAYTLADVNGSTLAPEDEGRLKRYFDACIAVTNKRFSMLLVVQPGIPLIYAEGKAAMSEGYIEHLNSLIMGLSVDERVKTPHFYVPRHMTDMKERIAALDYAVKRVGGRAVAERSELGFAQLH